MAKKRRKKRRGKSTYHEARKKVSRFLYSRGYEVSPKDSDEILLSLMDNLGYNVSHTSDTRKQIETLGKWLWNGGLR